jgi:hypothetical protein
VSAAGNAIRANVMEGTALVALDSEATEIIRAVNKQNYCIYRREAV